MSSSFTELSRQAPAPVVLPLAGIRAAIFDLDGVVTQTAAVHARAWKRLFDDFLARYELQTGTPFRAFDIETDYPRFVDGKPRFEGVQSFLESRGIHLPWRSELGPSIVSLGETKDDFFHQEMHENGVQVFPSTIVLIQELRRRAIGIGVVSSSRNCMPVLECAGIAALFDTKVDGIDLETLHLRGKPFPDTFIRAANQLHTDPAHAIVFEDALAGVEAGHAGGFKWVIGVNRAHQAAELTAHGADLVVDDLSQIRLEDAQGIHAL